MEPCTDIKEITVLKQPQELACSVCLTQDGTWVHLRTCQTCGITLCCDSSPGKHATQHFRETGHPVIISAEPGEQWMWCYVHEQFMPYQ